MFADAVFAILWQLVTIQVVVCASRIAKRFFPDCSGAELILHTSVLSIGICLVGLFAVGGIGLLYAWTAIGSVAFVGFVSDWLSYRYWTCGSGGNSDPRAINKFVALFWLLACSMLLGNVIANGLLRWPSDWDNLMYHLPFIDHWIQNGTLAATQSARWSMPASSELLGLWCAIPFSGDFLVALNNFPVIIVLVAALIELSRSMGMTGWVPHGCAFVCVCNQVTIRQSIDASNDLMVGAFFFAGLVYFGKLQQLQRGAPILLGVCIGVLIGTKYFAIGYSVILLVSTALWFARSNTSLRNERKVWIGFAAAIAMVGGYWFMRNCLMTGNPVFPIGSKEFAERLPYPGIHRTTLLFNIKMEALELVLKSVWKNLGPLHVFALAAIPAVLIWICFDREARAQYVRGGLILVFLGCAGIFVITPMLVEDQPGTMNHLRWGYTTVRYGLSFWTIVTLMFFLGLDHLLQRQKISKRPFLRRLILLAVPIQVCWTVANIEVFDLNRTLLSVLVGGIWIEVQLLNYLLSRRSLRIGIGVASILFHACFIGYLSNRWHQGLANHFNRYSQSQVFSSIGQTPNRILVLDERSYPFFGSRRQNYIEQPMLFYDVNHVWDEVVAGKLDIVATQKDASKEIARYRSASEALGKDTRFSAIGIFKNGGYRLFRPAKIESTR